MQNQIGIDFLDFTITLDYHCYYVTELFEFYIRQLDRWTNGFISSNQFYEGGGLNHWDTSYRWYKGLSFALFGSQNDVSMKNKLQVHITGEGIRELGSDNVYKILFRSFQYNINVTRIDICYDDFNKQIPVNKFVSLMKKYMQGKTVLTTNYRPESAQLYMGCYKGEIYHNVTFGNRTAMQYFRLYDKRVEQDVDIPYWYRAELELRHEAAQKCAEYIKLNFPDWQSAFFVFLNRMFRPLDREAVTDSDKHNAHRIPTARWWLDWTGSEEIIQIERTKPSVDRTVDDMLRYVDNSLAAFFKTLRDLEPGRLEQILKTSGVEGQSKPKYKKLIGAYKFQDREAALQSFMNYARSVGARVKVIDDEEPIQTYL